MAEDVKYIYIYTKLVNRLGFSFDVVFEMVIDQVESQFINGLINP